MVNCKAPGADGELHSPGAGHTDLGHRQGSSTHVHSCGHPNATHAVRLPGVGVGMMEGDGPQAALLLTSHKIPFLICKLPASEKDPGQPGAD
jgi:hypothetical protein